MFKRLRLIGVLLITMMALLQTQAIAGGGWGSSYISGWTKTGSIIFTSEWLVKNTKVESTSYEIRYCPTDVSAFYFNPSDATGGKPSHNFINNLSSITGYSDLANALQGKKTLIDEVYLGDCDTCEDGTGSYTGDGQLWYLFFEAANGQASCVSGDPVAEIDCIKMYLSSFAPNSKWWPYKVQINKYDAVLKAYQDRDRDGNEELQVYVEFANCTPFGIDMNSGTIEIPSGTIYSCSRISQWEYSDTDPTPDITENFCGSQE